MLCRCLFVLAALLTIAYAHNSDVKVEVEDVPVVMLSENTQTATNPQAAKTATQQWVEPRAQQHTKQQQELQRINQRLKLEIAHLQAQQKAILERSQQNTLLEGAAILVLGLFIGLILGKRLVSNRSF